MNKNEPDDQYTNYDFSNDASLNSKEKKELQELLKKADTGDIDAIYEIGRNYSNLFYSRDDPSLEEAEDWDLKAIYWCKKAAALGHVYANCCIGHIYYDGNGIDRDYAQAAHWYKAAADMGDAQGQFDLASLYQRGLGVEENHETAVYWLTKAAEQNHALACEYLGLCYRNGKGVEKDIKKAVYWLIKADEEGAYGTWEKLEEIIQERGAAEKYGFTSDMEKINALIERHKEHFEDFKINLEKERAAHIREQVKKGKLLSEIIPQKDLPTLAAIFASEEDYEILEKYIEEGLPLNERVGKRFKDWQPTPLFYITTVKVWPNMKDPAKMIAFLAKHGADPNIPSAEGDTPLGNQCFSRGTPKIMQALLAADADPNLEFDSVNGSSRAAPLLLLLCPDEYDEKTHIFTPLTQSQLERAKLLIEAGADVNIQTTAGDTPFSLAAAFSTDTLRTELLNYLIDKGANIEAAIESMKKNLDQRDYRLCNPVYGYALYEIYSGLLNDTVPALSSFVSAKLAWEYLYESYRNSYKPAEVLRKKLRPPPAGKPINRILLVEKKAKEKPPLLASKFFGVPDVWEGFQWPMARNGEGKEYRIGFMCQINCADAAKYDKDGLLPKTGMLYFFWDFEERPWNGKATVLYYDGDLGKLSPYIEIDERGFTPDGERFAWQQYTLDFEHSSYDDIDDPCSYAPEGYNSHFLLGKPSDSEQMGLGEGPPNTWQMILQMDQFIGGDDGFDWGGSIMYLCYFVSKKDLAKKDFSKAWFMLAVD